MRHEDDFAERIAKLGVIGLQAQYDALIDEGAELSNIEREPLRTQIDALCAVAILRFGKDWQDAEPEPMTVTRSDGRRVRVSIPED